jgi:hypothetical protein
VFGILGLHELEADFYFEGVEGKQVHEYVIKPYGWKEGDKRK